MITAVTDVVKKKKKNSDLGWLLFIFDTMSHFLFFFFPLRVRFKDTAEKITLTVTQ